MYKKVLNPLKSLLRNYQKKRFRRQLPFKGYTPSFNKDTPVDLLTDEELAEINNMFNWNCFTADAHGRRFGSAAWGNKRANPEMIPDRRIVMMNDKFSLTGRKVLEVGCFEGVHTLGLLHYTDDVIACDSRVDHVLKTLVRSNIYGYRPIVLKHNVESQSIDKRLIQADFLHHVGVLYHLQDPVSHLLDINSYIRKGIMLDTHYALPRDVDSSYIVDGKEYFYKRYLEHGTKEAFSGMYDHSKWLLLEDIINILSLSGYSNVDVVEERNERNGPRVLLFAERE